MSPILEIRGLSVRFHTSHGIVVALDDVDMTIECGETRAIMGESGCGKSVLALAVLRMLDADVEGTVMYRGVDVNSMDRRELLEMRGGKVSLVPQSPTTSFDPVIRIGPQVGEVLAKMGRDDADAEAMRSLERAGFEDPASIYDSYTHRLSGGMNERALIAMATAADPDLIIADEPTKGLDAFSRRDALRTLGELTEDGSLMMITHDFGAARTCDTISVMYAGQVVEEGPTVDVMEDPMHPYTRGLLRAQPCMGMAPIRGRRDYSSKDGGCRFKDRCDRCDEGCERAQSLDEVVEGRRVRCHRAKG